MKALELNEEIYRLPLTFTQTNKDVQIQLTKIMDISNTHQNVHI